MLEGYEAYNTPTAFPEVIIDP